MLYTVLGANGFIGSHLTRYLRACGHEVYAPGKGAPEILERNLGRLIYAVGLTADFRSRPYDTAEAHVGYLTKILREGRFTSLTYLSSARVYYGANAGSEDAMIPVFPDADGLYNLTKLTGEALCLQTGRGKVARLSNIVGDGASDSFVSQLINEARAGKVELRTALASSKDYLLIDDAVHALAALATHDGAGIYNVASGKNISTSEILEALSSRLNFQTNVVDFSKEFTFPVIDTSHLASLLNWQPKAVTQWLREAL